MKINKVCASALLSLTLILQLYPSPSYAVSNEKLKDETYTTVVGEKANDVARLLGGGDKVVVHFIGKESYEAYQLAKTWLPFGIGDILYTGMTENLDAVKLEAFKKGYLEGIKLIGKKINPKEFENIVKNVEDLAKLQETAQQVIKAVKERNKEPIDLTAFKILKYSILSANNDYINQNDWELIEFGFYKNDLFDFTGPGMRSNLPNGKVGMQQAESYLSIWEGSTFASLQTTCPVLSESTVRDVYYDIVQFLKGQPTNSEFGDYAAEMTLAYYTDYSLKMMKEVPTNSVNNSQDPYQQPGDFATASEPNESIPTAYTLQSGLKYQALLQSPTDVDWYKIPHNKDGKIRVVLSDVPYPISGYLYDENEKVVSAMFSLSSDTWVAELELKKGNYYVKISELNWGNSRSEGKYSISASYSTDKKLPYGKDYEPNDVIQSAFPINSKVEYHSNLKSKDDVDWYKFSLNNDGKARVVLSDVPYPINGWIYDKNEKVVSAMYTLTSDSWYADLNLTKGDYFIRINDSKGDYTISATYDTDELVYVKLNDQILSFEQNPIITKGSTLVPLRAIFEALGATVEWDANTRTVTAKKDNNMIVLQVGITSATVNGKPVLLENAAEIVNGSTMVPIRFVSESLNAKVDWDGENSTVIITNKS